MSEFKSMLRYLRKREKWSQDELAKRLKISKSTVSMYELGQRQPDFEMLENIADTFNVDMDFLMGRDSHLDNISSSLLSKFSQLTPANQTTVMGMIDLLLSQQSSESKKTATCG